MTHYEQGDVVLLQFPFTDLSAKKLRPAVVISANWFNRLRQDCILAAITSQVPPEADRDELVLSAADLKGAGLPKPSIVKLGKIITLEQRLIQKPLGRLPVPTLARVVNGVLEVISME